MCSWISADQVSSAAKLSRNNPPKEHLRACRQLTSFSHVSKAGAPYLGKSNDLPQSFRSVPRFGLCYGPESGRVVRSAGHQIGARFSPSQT